MSSISLSPVAQINNNNLTSSSLSTANNILFSFEKKQQSQSHHKKNHQQQSKDKSNTSIPPPQHKDDPSKQQQQQQAKVIVCKNCNKKGHKEKECPTPDINKVCSNCQKLGHISSNCKVIIVNFARSKPPQPERKQRRDKKDSSSSSSNGNNKVERKDHQHDKEKEPLQLQQSQQYHHDKVDSASSSPLSNSLSSSNSSINNPASSTTITTSIDNISISTSPLYQSQEKLKMIDIENIKYAKEVQSRQLVLNNDGDHLIENLKPEELKQLIDNILSSSFITSVSIPFNENQNFENIKSIVNSLHSNNIGVTFRISLSKSLMNSSSGNSGRGSEEEEQLSVLPSIPTFNYQVLPDNQVENTPISFNSACGNISNSYCLNNLQYQEQIKLVISKLDLQLKESNEKLDGIFFTDIQQQLCICENCKESMILNSLNPNQFKDICLFGEYTVENFKRIITQFILSSNIIQSNHHQQQQQQPSSTPLYKKKKAIPISVGFENTSNYNFSKDNFISSNYQEIEFSSSPSFSLNSHYSRTISNYQSIGKVCLYQSNTPILKSFDTLSYQLLYSLLLNGKYTLFNNYRLDFNNLNSNKFKYINRLYELMSCKEIYVKGKPMVELAVVCPDVECGFEMESILESLYGTIQLLENENYQFNVISHIESIVLDDLCRYKALILPDYCTLTRDQSLKIQKYINQGGSIFMSNYSGLDQQKKSSFAIPCDIRLINNSSNQYSYDRLIMTSNSIDKSKLINSKKNSSSNSSIKSGSGNSKILTMDQLFNNCFEIESNNSILKSPEHGYSIQSESDSNVLTIMNREVLNCSNSGSSNSTLTPSILFNQTQRIIYCANPIFKQYHQNNNQYISDIFLRLLDKLLLCSEKLVSIESNSTNIKVFLYHQKSTESNNNNNNSNNNNNNNNSNSNSNSNSSDKYFMHFLNFSSSISNNNSSYKQGDSKTISIKFKISLQSITSINLIYQTLTNNNETNDKSIQTETVQLKNFKHSNGYLYIDIPINHSHQLISIQ